MKRSTKARRFVVAVGGRIRGERKRLKLSQEALGKRLSADVPTISRIESGERDLRTSELYEVGHALGIPPRVLVDVSVGGGEGA
jgi:transcriptional regulator with XRE-family HTH domain